MAVHSFAEVLRLVYEVKQKENLLLDYKSGVDPRDSEGSEIAKDVSSFANHNGGCLIYGVKENGTGVPEEINGIKNPEELRVKIIQSAGNMANLNPPIFVEPVILSGNAQGKEVSVVAVNVQESLASPHFYRGSSVFWMRNADRCQPIEGTPEILKLLENRRMKMEEQRSLQLEESTSLSMNWFAKSYHPHHKKEDQYRAISVPRFFMSLQPRLFNPLFLDIRLIGEAIRTTLNKMQQKYSWPSSYSYSFFESSGFESYAATMVSKWYEQKPQFTANISNVLWSSMSSTGHLFHFEDMPYMIDAPAEETGNRKSQYAFIPTHVLKRILGFLLFAFELFQVLEKTTSFELKIQFDDVNGMLMLYHDRCINQRRIIENRFTITRSFTTLDMSTENLLHLVISDIAPELLICINYSPGHTFDANEVNPIKAVLKGS